VAGRAVGRRGQPARRDKREGAYVGETPGRRGDAVFGCDNYETNLVCVQSDSRIVLGLRVAPADTWQLGLRALSEKRGVTPEDASGLVSSRGVQTIGVLCGIDLIYLDSANRVLHLVEQLGPFRVSPVKIKCASILALRSRAIYFSYTTNRR